MELPTPTAVSRLTPGVHLAHSWHRLRICHVLSFEPPLPAGGLTARGMWARVQPLGMPAQEWSKPSGQTVMAFRLEFSRTFTNPSGGRDQVLESDQGGPPGADQELLIPFKTEFPSIRHQSNGFFRPFLFHLDRSLLGLQHQS